MSAAIQSERPLRANNEDVRPAQVGGGSRLLISSPFFSNVQRALIMPPEPGPESGPRLPLIHLVAGLRADFLLQPDPGPVVSLRQPKWALGPAATSTSPKSNCSSTPTAHFARLPLPQVPRRPSNVVEVVVVVAAPAPAAGAVVFGFANLRLAPIRIRMNQTQLSRLTVRSSGRSTGALFSLGAPLLAAPSSAERGDQNQNQDQDQNQSRSWRSECEPASHSSPRSRPLVAAGRRGPSNKFGERRNQSQ